MTRRPRLTWRNAPAVACLALACGEASSPSTGSAITTAATTTDSSEPTTTAGSTSASADATQTSGSSASTSGTGPLYDVGAETEEPTATDTTGTDSKGCTKVDFLFVIDNSGSMVDEQAQLIASFPGFIDTITSTLAASDFHIMTVGTDNGENTGLAGNCGNGVCNCTPAPTCCQAACVGNITSCQGFSCDDLPITACSFEYGSGRIYGADGALCGLPDGQSFMTSAQPDLEATFECIANIGTYGSGKEKPMLASSEAISPTTVGPGGCNEGFLRDDAILVLTFITDEEDDPNDNGSPGDPADWYATILARKGDDPGAVVVLGLVGDSNLPGGLCPVDVDPQMDGADPAPRLQSFVDMFEGGVIG
ncbi:MAG: hypothetical protein KC636_02820, partial [Myxococcales bacterium]|nr:hypothetical protein [Myxococcales bacterium]